MGEPQRADLWEINCQYCGRSSWDGLLDDEEGESLCLLRPAPGNRR